MFKVQSRTPLDVLLTLQGMPLAIVTRKFKDI